MAVVSNKMWPALQRRFLFFLLPNPPPGNSTVTCLCDMSKIGHESKGDTVYLCKKPFISGYIHMLNFVVVFGPSFFSDAKEACRLCFLFHPIAIENLE